ncbi:MAG: thioredoxin family protein [Thermoleophilaceae bacterium]|nr:thioredoxin family protein [Thermoleophilaceae bacterium]
MTEIGEPAPGFRLPDTEGREHSLPEGVPAVLIFTCNHCPYALAWHERIVEAARDYADRDVRFLAINPNDGERYPADSFEAMKERVDREQWPLPYLHDSSQHVAREYGARTTPDLFVVDAAGRIAYRGAADSDHADPSQNAAWLRTALDALLDGRAPDPAETEPVGCSIKWLA